MVWGVPEVWRQCYSFFLTKEKLLRDGTDGRTNGEIEGSTRCPRRPKKVKTRQGNRKNGNLFP